jgi:hypothetical protein
MFLIEFKLNVSLILSYDQVVLFDKRDIIKTNK